MVRFHPLAPVGAMSAHIVDKKPQSGKGMFSGVVANTKDKIVLADAKKRKLYKQTAKALTSGV